MSDETLFKVGRGIHEALRRPDQPEWAFLSSAERQGYAGVAQVAILELLNPGHEMTSVIVRPTEDRTGAVEAFNAMINEAARHG